MGGTGPKLGAKAKVLQRGSGRSSARFGLGGVEGGSWREGISAEQRLAPSPEQFYWKKNAA